MIDPAIIQKAFKGNIFELLGLEGLPEEKKLAMLEKFSDLIGLSAMSRVVEILLPSEREGFEKMMEESPNAAIEWLETKGIHFDEMLVEEAAKIKEDLAGLVKDIS